MTLSRLRLSDKGPDFSRIAHGLMRLADWQKEHAEVQRMIDSCLELGITTFDHADIYGDYTCESLFGTALAKSSVRREEIQLVTKCGRKPVSKNRPEHTIKHYDTSFSHIIGSIENSLKNLRTDYIDLLLIHRPDPFMNADEVAKAFSTLRESGKVLHFGVSNFLPSQFELLSSKMDFPLVTNQVEFSVMNMESLENGVLDMCQRRCISPMAWSPFAGGRLFTENTKQAIRLRDTLRKIGDDLNGASIDQIALAWILNHPAKFNVVLGTGNIDRIRKAVEADSIELSREQWFMIWTAATVRQIPYGLAKLAKFIYRRLFYGLL